MNNINYTSDKPVNFKSDDRFSRAKFSERIAQVISKRNDPSSIVMGLYGRWGDGKTSVLNFIEEYLKSDSNVICIKFNPWRFGTEDELLKGFFTQIATSLDEKLETTGDKVKDIVKKLAPAVGGLGGAEQVGSAVASFIKTPDIEEFKKRIEDLLQKNQKRVLFLIDDVDRLDKTEIHALFRLIKLTADFDYTAYILAFDKDIVSASLQERYSDTKGNAGEAFLEKIIQVPLLLPIIEKDVLRNFCFESVDEALNIADINLSQEQAQNFAREFTFAFEELLTTPRKAKLYGNTLMFSLPILKDEVNVVDLMLIEALRIFIPNLYDLIKNNKSWFAGIFSESRYTNHSTTKELIKKSIDDCLSMSNITNIHHLISLLKYLFPKLESVYGNTTYGADWYSIWNNNQRICSENYFSRFFTYSIPKNDISDMAINKYLEEIATWSMNENNPLNNILNSENTEQIINKLRNRVESIDATNAKKIIISITRLTDVIPNVDDSFTIISLYSSTAMLINDLVKKSDKQERKDLIKLAIKNSQIIDFKLAIFRWLYRIGEDGSRPDGFDENEVNDIGKYLADDIQSIITNHDFTKLVSQRNFSYLFWILNKHLQEGQFKEYINNLINLNSCIAPIIIDAYTPAHQSLQTGVISKDDFEQRHFDNLTAELDAEVIFNSIQNNFPNLMSEINEYPRYEDGDDRILINLKQFVWLYENRNNETTDNQ